MSRTLRLLWFLVCIAMIDKADGFSGVNQNSPSSSSLYASNSNVDEILKLIQGDGNSGNSYSKKTPEERAQILALMKTLEQEGSESGYLDDDLYIGTGDNDDSEGGKLLWDSYELAYFDRSIDGDRGSGGNNSTKQEKMDDKSRRPFGIRSKLLGSLFGLRYSFQHAVRPNRFVNDVGFKVLGLPAAVVAGGNFTRITQDDVKDIMSETGTHLRPDTAIRIDFEKPVLWLGIRRFFPLVFSLGSAPQSPPVTLCTTYMDDRIRLALAAKGGRLVFTRGGKTSKAFAKDWQTIETKRPLGGRVVATVLAVAAGCAWKYLPRVRSPMGVVIALPVGLVLQRKIFRSTKGEAKDSGSA